MPSSILKKLNKHQLRQALDAVSAPALIIDTESPERLIAFANGAAGQLLGLHPNELTGRSADSLAAEPFQPGQAAAWQFRTRGGAVVSLRSTPLYDQPGRASYWLLTTSSPERALDVTNTGVFAATDTWSRQPRDERLDVTTGIPGRTALLELLHRDWVLARREQRRISVMVFRIDALESYQTLFGRHATDTCLRRVAHAIANSLQRASDYCARVGNDRFAVLISGADEGQVATFAERIAQRVRDLSIHHPRSQLARYVTVSFAIASETPPATAEEPALLEDAESRVAGFALREQRAARGDDLGSLGYS
jgi:diguanylate cyclase (GGDEF)-like protein